MNGDQDICPIIQKRCIKKKCSLYGGVDLVIPGVIAGIAEKNHFEGCTFVLIAVLLTKIITVPRVPPPSPTITRH